MQAGHAAAFANVANQPVEHFRIGEHLADHAVQEYGVVLPDARVFQIVEVVVEDRLICAGVFGDELQHQISVGDRGVIETARRTDIDNQQLPRRLRRGQRLPRDGGVDLLPLLRRNAIRRGNRHHAGDRVHAESLGDTHGSVVVVAAARGDGEEQRPCGRPRRGAIAALVRPLRRFRRLLFAQLEEKRRRFRRVAKIRAENRVAALVEAARVFNRHVDAGQIGRLPRDDQLNLERPGKVQQPGA